MELTTRAPKHTNAPHTGRGLYGHLNSEWAHLATAPTNTAQFRSWGAQHPALHAVTSLHDLPRHVSQIQDTDPILNALLQLHQAGEQLAGRALVQIMLGKLIGITHSARLDANTHDGTVFETRAAVTVAAFWEICSTHPAGRGVASALALKTLGKITRPARLRSLNTVPLPETTDTWPAEDVLTDAASAVARLSSLLDWATSTAAISTEERALLERAYLSPDAEDSSRADLAAELGITAAALRKRTSRATARIRAAVIANTHRDHPTDHRHRTNVGSPRSQHTSMRRPIRPAATAVLA